MTVKATVNSIKASGSQPDVQISHLYGQKRTFQTSEPLKPVGDQSRYSLAWAALQQIDEKSA